MKHIGDLIREERLKAGMSAAHVASKLKVPITRQAFEKRERLGSFDWKSVIEVSDIIGVNPQKFLPNKQLKVQ